MSDTGIDGWHQAYLRARQIESEAGLPAGSLKPENTGGFSLVFVHLNEEQIRQLAHLWFVLAQMARANEAAHHPGRHEPAAERG